MKKNEGFMVGLYSVLGILINYYGKYISETLKLPFWLDSLGTAFSAYLLGPTCGAIVGAAGNIMYGINNPMAFLYALVNISFGIVIGIFAKKGYFEDIFKSLSVGVLITLISVCISTPINCILYHGSTGNVWGDSILLMMKDWGITWVIGSFVAEFFLDFFDKLLTVFCLYFFIKASRHLKKYFFNASVLLLGIFLLFTVSDRAVAGNDYESYIQTVYGNDKGLLSGEANDIAATQDGILWVGTYAGLYRYNGQEFRYMNQFYSVKNVNCLYTDEQGRMWIGTNDNGISVCINEEITHTLDEEGGLPSNSVRSIVQQGDGRYVIGTSGSLAFISLNGMVVDEIIPEINYATRLAVDENNHVAAVTATGELFVLDGSKIISKLTATKTDDFFSSCEFDEQGRLMVGSDKGIVYIYEISESGLRLKEQRQINDISSINSINLTEDGEIFLCGENGIVYLDKQGIAHRINCGSFSSSIDHMICDYQGNLWFSSSRLGVMKLCDSAFAELYPSVGMSEVVVNSITRFNGKLYIGTDNGLDIVDEQKQTAVHNELSEMLEGQRVRCVMTDSKGNLWLSTYGKGIICVDSSENISVFTKDMGATGSKFRFSTELSDGNIAVSGDLGITFIKNGRITYKLDSSKGLENPVILTMLELPNKNLLAGTDGGGIAIIRNGKVIGHYTRKDGLSSDVILRMVQDKDAQGVFVVTSNAINYLDYSKSEVTIRELKNFPYSNNYDLYDDGNGKLYVTGSAGIYVVNKADLLRGFTINCELLNYLSGLRGTLVANSWNFVDENNMWYLANASGVTMLNLESYNFANRSFRMILQSITVDGTVRQVDRSEVIELPNGSNNVSLKPEVINYSAEDPYIRYYLDGVDTTPNIVRQSELKEIVYTNFPSGNHKFYFAVMSNDGSQVLEEHVYTFEKDVEMHDHWWFRLYFFLELVLIIAWFTWFITRTVFQRTLAFQRKEVEFAREQIKMGNETILAIAKAVDAKDTNTSQHSTRVSEYSVLIGKRLGYSDEELENLRKAALLHDIGKIGIPDRVLNKSAKLNDEEYALMKSHVVIAGEILKDFSLIPNVQDGAMYHHERWDGKGYAHGLSGEDIPEWARIIGIADAFDAMTANRVYRKKLPFSDVLSEIRKGRGTQFDPNMVDLFLQIIRDGEINIAEIYGEEVSE